MRDASRAVAYLVVVDPAVSVVIPTHNRPDGLARVLSALRGQHLKREMFEVIVVDDGSTPPARADADGLSVRIIRHPHARGPAAARNAGWHAGRGRLIAFVDDDCAPAAAWLACLVRAGGEDEDMLVIQGPVKAIPGERPKLNPLSHTIQVAGPNRLFVSANIAYSRPLLEKLGGFDESFRRSGEDVELGARALKAGAQPLYSPEAIVYHEVRVVGLRQTLGHTLKWTDSVRVLAMHPELRDLLVARIFWKKTHPKLLLAAAGALSRSRLLAALAAVPYLNHYRHIYRGEPRELAGALPSHLAIDACEIGTAIAGSIRYRTLLL